MTPKDVSGKAGLDLLTNTGGIRVAFRMSSAMPVVEHSATRVDDGVYIWEVKIDSLSAIETAKAPAIRIQATSYLTTTVRESTPPRVDEIDSVIGPAPFTVHVNVRCSPGLSHPMLRAWR